MFLIATVACVVPSVALPADPKPDFDIKTNTVDISVTLDSKIKTDAGLAANCLAEGKKWAEKQRAEAEGIQREEPKFFPKDGYSYGRVYTVASVVLNRYVSIERDETEDTGGAHPNSQIETILWDRGVGKRISIRPFFTETADNGPTMQAMAKTIVAALKAEKKKRKIEDQPGIDWFQNIEPSLLKIGPVVLAPSTEAGKSSGLTFNYAPYAVGPYAEGFYRAFVPWQSFGQYLSPEGIAIFAGERPKSDFDKDQD
jgi:hypothetical protein